MAKKKRRGRSLGRIARRSDPSTGMAVAWLVGIFGVAAIGVYALTRP